MNVPATAQGVLTSVHQGGGTVIMCGAASIKGRRPQQEDMIMVHAGAEAGPVASTGEVFATQGTHSGFSLVGVFDGHGGKRCSRYAAQNLPENFHVALNELKGGSLNESDAVGPTMRLAYRMTHEDFARMARGEGEARPKTRQRLQHAMEKSRSFSGSELGFSNGNGVSPLHRSFPAHGEDNSFAAVRNRMLQQRMALGSRVWDDGSTALTCLIQGQRAFIANAGDSRAVGCIAGKVVPLSVDHKPNVPAERNRIQNAGGTVTSMMGCHRVMGMLAMSRALGDVMIEQYLSQVPDVVEQPLSARDFLIMASDGLWDVVSNQEAVQIVSTEASKVSWSGDQLSSIANKVCMEAFRRGSMDNISVLIILAGAAPHGGHQPPSQQRGAEGDARAATELPGVGVGRGMNGRAPGRNGMQNGKMSIGMGVEGPRRKDKFLKDEANATIGRGPGGLGGGGAGGGGGLNDTKSRLEPLGMSLRGSQTLAGGKRGVGAAGLGQSWKESGMPRAGRGVGPMAAPGKRAEQLLGGGSRRGASY